MSTLRVVSYAINGRGMGHLVRQLSILRWIKRITALLEVKCECWLFTSSEADTLARREGIPAFKMPSKAMLRDSGIDPTRYLALARTWVLNAISGLKPDLLLVDTFAGGSFGELVAALELAKWRVLVARRVREQFAEEDPYQALLSLYHAQIHPDARGTGPILIRERSELHNRSEARAQLGIDDDARALYLTLGGGGDTAASATLPPLCERLSARGWHVVVGAGPLYQGRELRGPNTTWLTRYCPVELFAAFDAAVSAGGYNTFHELMYSGVPTVFLPQPRIADDQSERVQRAAEAGAGRVASSIEQVAELLDDPGDPAAARRLVPANGARAAALSALSLALPADDLALADRVLSDEVVGRLQLFRHQPAAQVMELVRLAAGETPSDGARVRATLLGLADRGYDVPKLREEGGDAAARVLALIGLFDSQRVPFDSGLTLARALQRKFPRASAAALLNALEILLPCWKGYDDWMGAVSLLRAVPTQRGYPIEAFARDLSGWLSKHDDLFDALRELSRCERANQRPMSELLAELRARADEGAAQ